MAMLDDGELTSSTLVQRHLPGSSVVKAFSNSTLASLLTPARPADTPRSQRPGPRWRRSRRQGTGR
jgi:predicted dinucleotide-binding enzyme